MSETKANGRYTEEELDGYYAHYDWSEQDELATRLMNLIETITGDGVGELPSLHETVDVDALNSLFRPYGDGECRGPGSVTFPYAGYQVTVYSNGTIVVSAGETKLMPSTDALEGSA